MGRDEFDPRIYTLVARLMRRLTSVWFRFRLRGAERIPKAGPCLYVGNHSAIGIADVLCLLGAWEALFGLSRRVVGMMHLSFVQAPIIGWIARKFGAVHASYDVARAELAAGHDVITFPGGDLDAGRPFHLPRAVRFGNRRGYAKLALEAGVPIVPVATIGSHFTYLIVPGGEWLARALGLKRWVRCHCVPIPFALIPWAIAFVAWPLGWLPFWVSAALFIAMIVPNPVRITSEILEPIDVCAMTRDIADPRDRIEAAHAIVHGALTRHVATMQHARPTQRDKPLGRGRLARHESR